MLAKYGEDKVILNLGSGPSYFQGRRDIVNVDIFAFEEVDICAQAADLPIKSDTVDLVWNIGLLEHVESPGKVVEEMKRVLKPGGEAFIYMPFMYPIHGAPHDYQRLTGSGLEVLLSSFGGVDVQLASGTTSSMLAMMQEWLATLFSFKSKTLHDCILIMLMATTFPIKYLDKIITNHQISLSPGGFFAVVKK